MTGLKFELDIDAEIQKLGLTPAKPANSANQGEEVSNFSKISNLPDLKIKNSHLSVENATELFKERGWIQIYSGYLKQSIVLVRDEKVKVSDPSIPKYTQAEIQSLKDLTLDELKTLHEAKVLFKGKIIS
ncbi:MAG TPA: hypothetical protein EYO37_09690 [Nitrospina sp.]|jgi:hypothetical protein|nr:hypothetical protein [Nitrospina sp.]|tara:strand:- start:548 stop:937 length:390 start_codon:yes stop_codon:yes gene_type:complete